MKSGWFKDYHGDPSLGFRGGEIIPFSIDMKLIGMLSIFVIPSIAFLIILPGVRCFKLQSAFAFLFSMFVGSTLLGRSSRVKNNSLLVSLHYPFWQNAEATIFSSYKAFNSQRLDASLDIRIGLSKVNITLTGKYSLKPQ